MQETRIVVNTSGRIAVDGIAKSNGLNVVLVNKKDIPLAKYSFKSNKIGCKDKVGYTANNYKIVFDIVPTVIFENIPSNNN